jgi:uncharacterized protein (DUF58 family)
MESGSVLDYLQSRMFLRRLQHLWEKLAPLMNKLEFFRTSPSGHHTTPEIESHRPYAQGEDIRYIDWNLYARLDRFFIKTVVSEEEGLLHLVVDTSASMQNPHSAKHNRSLEIATGIAYLILASGSRLAVHACSDKLIQSHEYADGENDTPLMIHHMVSMPRGGMTDLGASLSGLFNLAHGYSIRTILITDLLDLNGYIEQIDRLKAQGARLGVIQLLHPREILPVFKGNFLFVDPETGERMKQTVGYRKLQSVRKGIKAHLLSTEEQFKSRSIPYLLASSQSDFEDTVLNFMTLPGWRGRP